QIELKRIEPNPDQPRKSFSKRQLDELTESIRTAGLVQPIVVRPLDGTDQYQIVAGERRFRAFQQLAEDDPHFKAIPAIVRARGDSEAQVAALVENLMREGLNPIERATALKELRTQLGVRSYEDLAERVGMSRRSVFHYLGMLKLRREYRDAIASGKLTEKHGRALKRLSTDDDATFDFFEYLLANPDVTGDEALAIAAVLKKRPGFTAEEARIYLQDDEVKDRLPRHREGPRALPQMQAVRGLKTFLKSMDSLQPTEISDAERAALLTLIAEVERHLENLRRAWASAGES
ncbi:MAG: ParB/RepB/Spo0J family partition protein, partial [Myxococcales bacterium]|nr:ParB/RepB/Spo0J family partition protein [Myxococcales bacterium]